MSITIPHGYDVAARLDPEVLRRTAHAREDFLGGDGRGADRAVRPDILHSWNRSRRFGIDTGGLPRRSDHEVSTDSALAVAALPVLEKMSEHADNLGVTAFVVDRAGMQVLPTAGDADYFAVSATRGAVPGGLFSEDVAGTNGAGMSILRLEPFVVVGHEHYQDVATRLMTFGVPLRDALKRIQGHFVLCAAIGTAHPIMIPHALGLAGAITDRLVEATDRRDREAFAEFLRHGATPSTPVMVFNDRFCCLNTVAQQMLLTPQDIDLMRATARDAVANGNGSSYTLTLGVDTYRVRCRTVADGAPADGIVASFHRVRRAPVAASAASPSAEESPAVARLRRARTHRIPAIVRGEPGSGRARLAHSTGPLKEIAAADAATDPEAWRERLRDLLAEHDVLVLDIDTLAASTRRAALELARDAVHWCAATAGPHGCDLDVEGSFPVVVDREPLRARKDEIPALVLGILAEAGAPHVRLSQDAKSVLARYSWPGNERQLRSTILGALTQQTGGRITLEHLPKAIAAGSTAVTGGTIDQMERELIFEALKNAGWRRDAAADALGISRSTMYRKLRQFPFEVPSSRT